MGKRSHHHKVTMVKVLVDTYRSVGNFWGIFIIALISGILSIIFYMGWREASRGEYRPWQPGYETSKQDVAVQREADIMRYKLNSQEGDDK